MPLSKLLMSAASALDRRYGWDKLPLPLGVLTLIGLRTRLRKENLYDTGESDAKPTPADGRERTERLTDGSYNDLVEAGDGHASASASGATCRSRRPSRSRSRAAGAEPAHRQPGAPARATSSCPATIAQRARRRRGSSSRSTTGSATARPSRSTPASCRSRTTTRGPDARCRSERTRRDPSRPPTTARRRPIVTDDTHWWDGSQIYGSDPGSPQALCAPARTASCALDADGLLPLDLDQRIDLPASPGTAGSASRCCTRSSRASTTRSATGCAPSLPDAGPTTSCSTKRPPDQRRADGEDPHRRVDAGDHRAPDHAVSRCARTGGASLASGQRRFGRLSSQRGAQRHPGLADATTTASRTRSPRSSSPSTACTRCMPDDFTFRSSTTTT